jgi:2-keto-4-pentenoate hydratase/2-oxohepta-3-ene-1,7-dioic acid hydratase in catechol pathway
MRNEGEMFVLSSTARSCRIGNVSIAGCPPFPALMVGDSAIALNALKPFARQLGLVLVSTDSIAQLLEHWDVNQPTLLELASRFDQSGLANQLIPQSALKLHAPVLPGQVFCTIGNYRSQVTQAIVDSGRAQRAHPGDEPSDAALLDKAMTFMSQREQGLPYVCSKSPTAVIGPHDTLHLPSTSDQVDWEVELAVVIGKPAKDVPVERALEHVAAFTIANDITLRDRVFRADPAGFGTDWLQSKNAPGFLPLGPYLVPARSVINPKSLRLSLSLNGQAMQEEAVEDMIFDVAQQLSYISQHVQLLTGDVICTGSPAGFGSHYQRYLGTGDHLHASIEGFGSQHTLVR